MQILTSYNWIKEYLDTKLSPEEFAQKTTDAGNSVEVMDDIGKRFDKMVVGDVAQLKDHPDADALKIAITDIGKKKVQIVCGGENLAKGMKVVVGLPGSKVRWHGEGDWVELKETKIRGESSYGMICAVEEIGFEKLPHGEKDIWDISDLTDAKAGTPAAKALGLDDHIMDIEVTSNRPDCKSIIGQARDGAAATESKFKWVQATPPSPPLRSGGTEGFSVAVKDKDLCPRYTAVVIDNIKIGPSPWWMQKKLLLAGFKPINNLVDITNYVLHEYGQPLHTFDADKLEGKKIVVRRAKKGEKMIALDESELELTTDMLVIADAKKPVAIAGVMGGMETGTTEETSKVLIECATFDSVSVRRTSRALNLYSDSQLLFEKGLSTEALGPALNRAIELIVEFASGEVVSPVMDERAGSYKPLVFSFDPERANELMGIEMDEKKQKGILERLGFGLAKGKKGYDVSVPYWRDHDIEDPVDFVEEIARVYGYGNFPSRLPEGRLPQAREDMSLVWQRRVKELLAGAGLSEAYSYAFVSCAQLESYFIEPDTAVKIRNTLSTEHEYMRTSLIPSMLATVEENQARIPEAEVFELAPVYLAKKDDIPDQELRLMIGVYGKDGVAGFLRAKGALKQLFYQIGITQWELCRNTDGTRWHQGRSAEILVNGKEVGVIGQVSRSVANGFGLDVDAVLVDLDFESLVPLMTQAKAFTPVPQYPSVKRDLAFVVQERTEAAAIEEAVFKTGSLIESFDLFDVYRGKGTDEGQKSMAAHLSFRSDEKTLSAEEVDAELNKIRDVLTSEFGATMRS